MRHVFQKQLQMPRENSSLRITLFYSVKKPSDAIFLEELISMQNRNKNFRVFFTSTQNQFEQQQHHDHQNNNNNNNQAPKAEIGNHPFFRKGRIDRQLLQDSLPFLGDEHEQRGTSPLYFLCGPASMLQTIPKYIMELSKTDNENNVRYEKWW